MSAEVPSKESARIAPSAAELEELVDLYTDNLMRGALGLNFNAVESEELVQATFCAYLEGGARFAKQSRLLTYLFGILYNKARESRRLSQRTESLDAIEATFEDHFDADRHWNQQSMDRMTEVEHQAQSTEIGALLRECLEGVSAMMRMAFTLKEVDGLASKEICAILGCTMTHLGVLLFRTRNKLRECLMARGAVIV